MQHRKDYLNPLGDPFWLAALGALLSLALVTAAPADDAGKEGEKPAKINYEDHIKPIFRENCFFCHSVDDANSDLALDNFARVMQGGSSGAVIVPGDPEASRLWKLVSHQESPEMPPEDSKMPDEQLALIRNWIAAGALETARSKAKLPKKPAIDLSMSAGADKPQGEPVMPQGLLREPPVYTSRGAAVTAIAASPWAPLVAVAGQQQIVLYHSETAELLGILPFPEGIAHVLRFSRSGSLLLAGGGHASKSGKVVVFDVETGDRVIEVGDEYDVVLAADINENHTRIALAGPQRVVRIFDTSDGELLHEIRKHTDWVYALEFSPDGVLLATADRAGGLFVWEADTAREYQTLKGHGDAVTGVSWRLDSNVLASSSEDGTIRLWEMLGGKQIKSWNHGGGVAAVHFAHDGRLVTAGRDRHVTLWDQEGQEQRKFGPLDDLALRSVITHDGTRIVGGDWTGDIRLWNAEDGAEIAKLPMNPPTLAMRAEAASAEAAQAAEAAAKAAAELAEIEKSAADAAQAAKTASEALAAAETAAQEAAKANEAAEKDSAEKIAAAKAAAEALAAAQAALEKAETAREEAEKLAAQKAAALETAGKAAETAKAEAEQAAAGQAELDKTVAEKRAALEAAQAKAEAAQAAAEKAAAEKAAHEAQAADQAIPDESQQASAEN